MTTLCKCGMEWYFDNGSDDVRRCDDCAECRGEIAANDFNAAQFDADLAESDE